MEWCKHGVIFSTKFQKETTCPFPAWNKLFYLQRSTINFLDCVYRFRTHDMQDLMSRILVFICLFLTYIEANQYETLNNKKFQWDLIDFNFNVKRERFYGGIAASTLLGNQSLYISITTISGRIRKVTKIIQSILNGIVIPTHIYLFISKDKFMLDKGIIKEEIPLELQYIAESTSIFSIIYTDNIGPHRKLLPILQRYWEKDCVIVTFDDDKAVAKDAIFRLITHYIDNNKEAIVGLRTRRIGFCALSSNNENRKNKSKGKKSKFSKNLDKSVIVQSTNKLKTINYDFCLWPHIQNLKKEMMILPTGNGGILYRPKFFHQIVFDPILRGLTMYNDDLTFRIATLANQIYVVNGCCGISKKCHPSDMSGTNNTKILPPVDSYTDLRKYLLQQNLFLDQDGILGSRVKELIGKIESNSMILRGGGRDSESFLSKSEKRNLIESQGGKDNNHENSSNEIAKIQSKPEESKLYSKNLYWNTDMWLAAVAYLKHKNIDNVKKFYNINFLSKERPECIIKTKGKKISFNNNTTLPVKISKNDQYIMKNKKGCGIQNFCPT